MLYLKLQLPYIKLKLITECNEHELKDHQVIKFIPFFRADLLRNLSFDIAFNSTSFPEMSTHNKHLYCELLKNTTKKLYENNRDPSPELNQHLKLDKIMNYGDVCPWQGIIRIYRGKE